MYTGFVSYEKNKNKNSLTCSLRQGPGLRKRSKQRHGPGQLKAPNRQLPNYGPYELDMTWAPFDASINEERVTGIQF